MKKLFLHTCICAFCLAITTSCSKSVKTPSANTTTAAKTTSTGATTTAENQDQDNQTCGGGQSTSSGSQTGY